MPFEIIGQITDIETIAAFALCPLPFAVCINNLDYPASLELHRIYQVLPDDDAAADGDLRIIDESGEDYLYPAVYFVLCS